MKRALVISGGGAKGAFAVGALEHLLLERQLTFEIVSGTSTGALIAPMVIAGDLGELIHTYSSVTTEDILRRRELANVLRANAIFDTGPFERLIRARLTPSRVARVLGSTKQMIVTAVCLQTGRISYFYSGRSITAADADVIPIRSRDEMIQAVLASSNQPVFMRPVNIPAGRRPPRQYCDGGVREIAPLRVAIDNGATDVYAIILSPETREARSESYSSIVPILLRTIGLFTEDVVLNDVETARLYNKATLYLQALRVRMAERFQLDASELDDLFEITGQPNPFKNKAVLTLHVIRPTRDLGEGLEFRPQEMAVMMQTGRERAAAVLDA